jgi:hypothetical protein
MLQASKTPKCNRGQIERHDSMRMIGQPFSCFQRAKTGAEENTEDFSSFGRGYGQ